MTTPPGESQGPEPPPGPWQQSQSEQPGYGPPPTFGEQSSYPSPPPAYPANPPTGPFPQYGAPYAPPAPTQSKAVAAMVVGIVSLVLACGYGVGLLGSPVAWWLGSSSMREIDASQGRLSGRGMAQAGRILGIVGTVLLVLLVVGVLGLLAVTVGGGFQ
jgi:Domain of unknown function (DUF4190)